MGAKTNINRQRQTDSINKTENKQNKTKKGKSYQQTGTFSRQGFICLTWGKLPTKVYLQQTGICLTKDLPTEYRIQKFYCL